MSIGQLQVPRNRQDTPWEAQVEHGYWGLWWLGKEVGRYGCKDKVLPVCLPVAAGRKAGERL